MTACPHRYLDAADGLVCVRDLGHLDGHQYEASAGADLGAGTEQPMGDDR